MRVRPVSRSYESRPRHAIWVALATKKSSLAVKRPKITYIREWWTHPVRLFLFVRAR